MRGLLLRTSAAYRMLYHLRMLHHWLTTITFFAVPFDYGWRTLLATTYVITAAALLSLPLPAYRVLRAKFPNRRNLGLFFGAFGIAIIGILAVAPFAAGAVPNPIFVAVKFLPFYH
ncbi:MAG: hypothetical protein EOP11_20380 [Proteobacteria bacterium]|nr:MAG: hypothetical protein EOP11_20380 [Pseudomonadota bacterium]